MTEPRSYPATDRGGYVYVLRCARGALYTGFTVDLARRLRAHATGRGARYTRANPPEAVVGVWSFASASTARRAEARLKRLSRPDKLGLLARCAGGEPFGESAAFDGVERPMVAGTPIAAGVAGEATTRFRSTVWPAEQSRRRNVVEETQRDRD